MRNLIRRTGYGTRLILIVSIHIFLIMLNGYITFRGIQSMELDARVINQTGVIRGGVQKISKLESNNQRADQDIAIVDSIFNDFLKTDRRNLEAKNMHYFIEALYKLRSEWVVLKRTIYLYRDNNSQKNRDRIIRESEEFWSHANATVELAQRLSETKLHTFQMMFFIFFIDFLLIMAIIGLINSTIRHNLEKSSRIDSLTGIFNRKVYNEEIVTEIHRVRRYGGDLALVIMDVDHFKEINDEFGHNAGDRVLVQFCSAIQGMIRKSDFFCRIGGEEFAIIAAHTSLEGARSLGVSICETIEKNDFGLRRGITVSIGIAVWEAPDDAESMFRRADIALYQAKSEGRNRVCSA